MYKSNEASGEYVYIFGSTSIFSSNKLQENKNKIKDTKSNKEKIIKLNLIEFLKYIFILHKLIFEEFLFHSCYQILFEYPFQANFLKFLSFFYLNVVWID